MAREFTAPARRRAKGRRKQCGMRRRRSSCGKHPGEDSEKGGCKCHKFRELGFFNIFCPKFIPIFIVLWG